MNEGFKLPYRGRLEDLPQDAAGELLSTGKISAEIRLVEGTGAFEFYVDSSEIPNAKTREAMRAVERGEVTTVTTVDELLADLNAP